MMTEAQKRAKAKYLKKTYKTLTCNITMAKYDNVLMYAKANNLSMNKTIQYCLEYCMNNGIILHTDADFYDK